MSDRPRLTQTVRPSQEESAAQDQSVLPGLLRATFQQISNSLAGPDAERLPPMGASDVEAQGLIPASDPDALDLSGAEEFTPDLPQNMPEQAFEAPEVIQGEAFSFADLPQATAGSFFNKGGRIVFSTGVDEAPDNKSHRNHPTYRKRAEFVSEALNYVISNFDASSAGQYRDINAEVTANRSHNSDHYSGGAFDVRAGSQAEAQRILVWASQQPWVSFAQTYPNSTLVHISANIAAFGGTADTSIVPDAAQKQRAPSPTGSAPVPPDDPLSGDSIASRGGAGPI